MKLLPVNKVEDKVTILFDKNVWYKGLYLAMQNYERENKLQLEWTYGYTDDKKAYSLEVYFLKTGVSKELTKKLFVFLKEKFKNV